MSTNHTPGPENNAALIAAAPELLAALEAAERKLTAMVRHLESSMPNGPEAGTFEREDQVIQTARAAIMKAKGE